MPHQCTNCGLTFEDGSKEMLSGCPDCGGNKFQFRPARSESPTAESAGSSGQQSSTPQQSSRPQQSSQRQASPSDDTEQSTEPREWPNTPDDVSPADGATETNAGTDTDTQPRPSATETQPSTTDAPEKPDDSPTERTDDTTARTEDAAARTEDTEDTAQASARSDVVSKEELEASATRPDEVPDTRAPDAGDAPEPPDADGEVVEAPEATNPDLEQLREELNEQFESIKIVAPGQYELNLMGLYDREEYIVSLQEDGRYVIEVPETWQGPGGEES